jgi:hypothetical protein
MGDKVWVMASIALWTIGAGAVLLLIEWLR